MIRVIKAADLNQYADLNQCAEDDELTSSTLSLSGVAVWGTRLEHLSEGNKRDSGRIPHIPLAGAGRSPRSASGNHPDLDPKCNKVDPLQKRILAAS